MQERRRVLNIVRLRYLPSTEIQSSTEIMYLPTLDLDTQQVIPIPGMVPYAHSESSELNITNGHPGNQDDSEDENLFGIKKTTYWEIYGVKRFQYSGKRKFTPLLYQSFDGRMVVTNDVFGLTISQFERIYKACLERRKTKEQWILNLRYHDKSSNEYLEYLENCTDCITGHLLCFETNPREKCLYEHLVQIVGTEINIRKRQRLFIIENRLFNSSCFRNRTQISSGSLAEGLDLPGSDMDVMYVLHDIEITQNEKNIKNPKRRSNFVTCVMEIDIDHPWFAILRPVAAHNEVSLREQCGRCPLGTCTGTQFYLPVKLFLDLVKQEYSIIDTCEHGPCISDQDQTIDIAFCMRKELDIDTFQLPKLYYCFSLCLDKLMSWVNTCYCPNYFIPEHNMFIGKINQSNKNILLGVLESIKFGGIDGLITSLFPSDNSRLASANSESQSVMLDFLFYRITRLPYDSCWTTRTERTKSLLKSESSTFINNVCTYHYARASKIFAQLLPSPSAICNTYNIRKCYHKLLQNGTKSDAVSGWLLYASFYYVTGQFNVSLRLPDYVLSRCLPDMMQKDDDKCEVHRNCYRQNIHSTMNLNDRMKIATIGNVEYIPNSSSIPEELKLEVETQILTLQPVVMSNCLNVLCYHHLGDIYNRQKSLRDLYLTVTHRYSISQRCISASITVLGVCYEISGDKDLAYRCYEEALRNGCHIFISAEKRKSKLEGN
ncbi:unnamed protein product [Mytilus coruscus]|uniref:Mab-21-like HhH/H2TH-like domain-containing protein n=1 Tax=Mytilus coruscus TaxID=42192 RepID=A0A6J8BLB1_MYTCO|nr:unnamed protein product [Mytilus coruscus]